ncbi:hypothetical protein JCM21900_001220 [Sporobolomyces salmonicolor]
MDTMHLKLQKSLPKSRKDLKASPVPPAVSPRSAFCLCAHLALVPVCTAQTISLLLRPHRLPVRLATLSHLYRTPLTVSTDSGWLAPPVAILVRFGIGFDFFLNIILTICGYIPGHFHNFYCQSIRNNKTKSRTPRWAVKAGLVEIKDPRSGRHQWAHRYDERLPDSSRTGYDDSEANSLAEWDGRGPEPARTSGRNKLNGRRHQGLAPWDNVVDDSEVEGEPDAGLYRSKSNLNLGEGSRGGSRSKLPLADPLDNEQFYPTAGDNGYAGDAALGRVQTGGSVGSRKKKGKMAGLLGGRNRDRYAENASSPGSSATELPGSRSRGADEYQDEFEREINQGGSRGGGRPQPAVARFDSFEQEGPEEAWATSRPARGAAVQGNAPAARSTDDDFLNHTF